MNRIEKIIGKRVRNKQVQFEVKWNGFDSTTWLPIDRLNFPAAIAAIQAFESEGKEDYEVEAVLDKRDFHGQLQYKMKWKGYPSSKNSWVPAVICDCKEAIQEFEVGRLREIVGMYTAWYLSFYFVKMQ